jgi:hypothetical protein
MTRLDKSMRNSAPVYRNNVVTFPQRHSGVNRLTAQDKKDVAEFRPQAEAAGYDALMIHVMAAADNLGTRDYVTACRTGQAWSSWGFARNGDIICSWNTLTSRDTASFSTMSEALGCILLGRGGKTASQSDN